MNEIDGMRSDTELMQPQSSKITNKPVIAGFLLLFSGIISIILWFNILSIDTATINSIIDISDFQEINPDITIEQIQSFLGICATIGIVISVFQILGGVLALKRKFWELCIITSVIGIFNSLPLIIVAILPLVSLILVITAKKEFKNKKD